MRLSRGLIVILLFSIISNSYSQDSLAWINDGVISEFINYNKLKGIKSITMLRDCNKCKGFWKFVPELTIRFSDDEKVIAREVEYFDQDTSSFAEANKYITKYERNDSICLSMICYEDSLNGNFYSVNRYFCKPDTVIITNGYGSNENIISDTVLYISANNKIIKKLNYSKGPFGEKWIGITNYHYDNNGNLIMLTDKLDRVFTKYDYDSSGVLTDIIKPYIVGRVHLRKRCYITKYFYDKEYNPSKVITYTANANAKNKRILSAVYLKYNNKGLPISERDYRIRHILGIRIKISNGKYLFTYTYKIN